MQRSKILGSNLLSTSAGGVFFPKHGFLSGLVTPACGSGQEAPPVSIEAVCVVVWRAVWSCVDQCGAVWGSVEQFGVVWISVDPCGAVWDSLEQDGAEWRSVEQFGSVWSIKDSFGVVGAVWTRVVQCGTM